MTKRIFIPTHSLTDWQRLLAKPDLHWQPRRSALTAAAAWEDAEDHLPPEIAAALEASGAAALQDVQLLVAIPEWGVELPGGERPSQTDILALCGNDHGLVAIAVEAKVDEPFGPTLAQTRADASPAQQQRLDFLHDTLGLSTPLPDAVRYQLVHRTASAILVARAFHAGTTVMVVQSFDPKGEEGEGWRDFQAFATALDVSAHPGQAALVPAREHPALFVAWCAGDQRFRDVNFKIGNEG
jgi:hypothetical protein